MIRFILYPSSFALVFALLVAQPATTHAQVVSSAGISTAAANSLGLERAWVTRAAVDASRGYLVGMVLHKGVLFLTTSQGVVQAIDAEHGATYWTTSVGRPEHVTLPPGASDKYVVVTNGSYLFCLDRRTGRVDSQRKMRGAACAGAGVSETHCYIPMYSGAIEIFPLKNERELDKEPTIFFAAGSSLNPPLIRNNRLFWTSKNGFVYGDGITKSEDRFRFQTGGQVLGGATAILIDKEKYAVYAGSHDGVVYAVRDPDGSLLWRHQTGNPLVSAPVVVGDAVYALNDAGRVTRLNYLTGVVEWEINGAERFVSASPTRVYVADRSGNLLMLDAGTGGLLGAGYIGPSTVPFVNDQTDRAYIVATNGLIQCLRERALIDPVAHQIPGAKPATPMMPMGDAPAADAAASPFSM